MRLPLPVADSMQPGGTATLNRVLAKGAAEGNGIMCGIGQDEYSKEKT